MATNDIGRVTPIWRGFYSAATTYELNDIVIDTTGSVWWHKSEELTTGVIPETGEIWDAVIDMSIFSGLIQAAITTAQTALAAAQEAVAEVTADTERAETAAQNAENSAAAASESAAGVGALAQAAERSAEAAAGSATGAAGSAQAAAGSKSDAEAYAVGKRGGEDVGSTDPTYHNNAKYYAEQAASEAEAAAQSAEDAQDVLDSIPEDYSQLSADVSDLKTHLSDIEEYFEPVPDTINLYDKEHNAEVLTDPQYTRGTVYLYGYYGDIVISSAANMAAYITTLHVYNANGEDMGVDFGETISRTNPVRQGKVITIPEGAVYLTFVYRTYHSTIGTLVSDVMVTKGDTLELYVEYRAHDKITDIVGTDLRYFPVYVSTSGSDENDGKSIDNAFATFNKALSVSDTVFVERGTYAENVIIDNRKNIKILPYDNNETYEHSKPTRKKIVLNGGVTIDAADLSNTGTIYSCHYERADGANFKSVFEDHTLAPVISGTNYRANVFVHYPVTTQRYKLKPVLTYAECEAETKTFYWDAVSAILYCNIADTGFDSITVIKNMGTMISVTNSENVYIEDLSAEYCYTRAFYVAYSDNVNLFNCEASYSGAGMGFEFINTNGRFENCYATHNAIDGFNYHGYGVTVLNDCTAEYNYDDGCSHHDGCVGIVRGGVYKGNGKGGISPAYGAKVDIYEVIAEENTVYGIGYLSTDNGHAEMKGIVESSVMVDNPTGLVVHSLCSVTTINCKYSGNTTDKSIAGTIIEY